MRETRHVDWMTQPTYDRMLTAALEQRIELRPVPRFRWTMAATSSSLPGVTYLVNEHRCTCPAGSHGRPCKHRALYLHAHLGRLRQRYGRVCRCVDAGCSSLQCAA